MICGIIYSSLKGSDGFSVTGGSLLKAQIKALGNYLTSQLTKVYDVIMSDWISIGQRAYFGTTQISTLGTLPRITECVDYLNIKKILKHVFIFYVIFGKKKNWKW